MKHFAGGCGKMYRMKLRIVIGLCAVCFGAGIFLSFVLPYFILAFIEAAVLVAAGILLLKKEG